MSRGAANRPPIQRFSAKPAPGTQQRERQRRRSKIEAAERSAKVAARARDNWTCRRCGAHPSVDAAHLTDKGMGGDHGRHSSHQRDFVTLCGMCHRGPRSVHSSHVRLVAGPEGGDGVVRFELVEHPGVSNTPQW